MLAENGVELEMTDAALNFLSQVGYDPEFGSPSGKKSYPALFTERSVEKVIVSGSRQKQSNHC